MVGVSFFVGLVCWLVQIGQLASTRADFLPPQYYDRVKMLQSDTPAEPPGYIRQARLCYSRILRVLYCCIAVVVVLLKKFGWVHANLGIYGAKQRIPDKHGMNV